MLTHIFLLVLAELEMNFKCSCGAVYKIAPQMAGKKVKCRQCERSFTIPLPPTQSASPNPKAAPQKPPASQDNYWAPLKTGEPSEPDQQPKTRKKQPMSRPKQQPAQPRTKREKEAALLDKYSSGSSLEERMAERRKERIEDGRVSNGIAIIVKGAAWLIGSFVLFLLLRQLDEQGFVGRGGFGRRRGLIMGALALLYLLRAKFWLPPLIALIGVNQLYIGIGSLTGKVDIDDQADFPGWDE